MMSLNFCLIELSWQLLPDHGGKRSEKLDKKTVKDISNCQARLRSFMTIQWKQAKTNPISKRFAKFISRFYDLKARQGALYLILRQLKIDIAFYESFL